MQRTFLVVAVLTICALPAQALDARIRAGLLKLDLETRLEQRCDVEVLDSIAQDNGYFDPDRVVAYATKEPKVEGDEIKTRGGAFRSKGEWYHLSFRCLTTPDHMQVLSLRYKIGDKIPLEEWEQYNLYP